MPIEKKTGLFYELLIRGVWDPSQGTLGSISTYQLTTGTAIVDTDTNVLVTYSPDQPKDIARDQAVSYLDEKFAGFLEQLSAERATTAASESRARGLEKKIGELQSQLTNTEKMAAEMLAIGSNQK